MGSSFAEHRGTGFWSRGATIELGLYLLAQEVRQRDSPPAWLRAAAEDWHLPATVGMGGCASAALDKHALSPSAWPSSCNWPSVRWPGSGGEAMCCHRHGSTHSA